MEEELTGDKLVIRLRGVEARYTREHKIVINGGAYPRQLRAINAIVEIFKTTDKEDLEQEKTR